MWIKICGITRVNDAVMIAESGANAIGLNFYSKSKRYVGIGADDATTNARDIAGSVRGQLDVVGVFVNSDVASVVELVADVGLDAVQFHGDESAQQIADVHHHCPDVAVIRAFRVGSAGTAAMDQHLGELQQLNVPVAAVLIDALVEGEYGGTGHTVDVSTVHQWTAGNGQPFRLVLAGGLTPDNVAAAVTAVSPWGIDTASGVEQAAGIKDACHVQTFVDHARQAISVDDSVGVRLR